MLPRIGDTSKHVQCQEQQESMQLAGMSRVASSLPRHTLGRVPSKQTFTILFVHLIPIKNTVIEIHLHQ